MYFCHPAMNKVWSRGKQRHFAVDTMTQGTLFVVFVYVCVSKTKEESDLPPCTSASKSVSVDQMLKRASGMNNWTSVCPQVRVFVCVCEQAV